MATRPRVNSILLVFLLPVAAVALCYANSLWGDFVWDDRRLILDDRAITSWRRLGELFGHDFFYRSEDDLPYGYYRPLVSLSYLIDYTVWGLRPFGYHLTNLLIHAGCTVLVSALALELGWSAIVAVLAATLFAVHPVHTENVAWIAGRTDVLAFLFSGLALLAVLRADRNLDPSGGTQEFSARFRHGAARPWMAAAIPSFAAAMLAKEISVVVIIWAALALHYLRNRSWPDTFRRCAPMIAVVFLYAVLRFAVLAVEIPGQAAQHPLATLLSMPPTLLRYLLWLVWPYPLNAYVQNPYVEQLSDPRLLLSAVALAAMMLGLWRARSTRVQVLAMMVLAAFAPVLNIIRLAGPSDMGNIMAERFCYFPSFPFAIAAAWAMERAAARWLGSVSLTRALAVAGIPLVAMALMTIERNRDWADEKTFLKVSLAQTPTAVLLWGNLAQLHLRERDVESADRAIRQVEQLRPGSYSALSSRSSYLVMKNHLSDAIPLQEQIVANSKRGRVTARNNLAYLYRKTGDSQRAAGILHDLLAKGAGYADVYFNLGEIYRERGDLSRARQNLELALEDRPNSRSIATALAIVAMDQKDFAAAESIYERLLRLYPNDARLMNNLALVYHRRGDARAALQTWQRALAADPSYETARVNYDQAIAAQKASNLESTHP